MKTAILIGSLVGLLIGAVVHIIDVHWSLHQCRVEVREANGAVLAEYRNWISIAAEVRGKKLPMGGP